MKYFQQTEKHEREYNFYQNFTDVNLLPHLFHIFKEKKNHN